ncbi:MAG: AIR synthase-related protein, partial [Syntrophales bacterium]|nr:AIR synthase-related protein [Syntrophales bacterium]
LTGIVGVNRDPFGTGKGAKLIFNTDVFCFASPMYDKPLPKRILHPRRIYEGVREGVEHGGNKSGIPTVNGCIVFDDRYLGKPLVYCGTGGIMPARIQGQVTHTKEIAPGDLIVMTGGRIGKDGIHGATFSSEELHEGSPVTAVQIGDPITQKKMTDFLLKARDLDLYRCITDNGAGGLSSSVGETARLSGGCELDLKKAPLKYPGLNPWEILISESQERMTLAVDPQKIDEFLKLARKMDVEATVLGTYTDSGMFHIFYGDETVAYLRMDFLHNGLPQMKLNARWSSPRHAEPVVPAPVDMGDALKKMLARLNICSKESVVRRYDHEVQGGSVVKPLTGIANDGPSDAAVIRPLLDSFEGIVVANGICPRYSDIDTYAMAACAIDEAIRNTIAVGGNLDHLAGLDNFCWCDPVQSEKTPDGEYKLAQLVRANMALYDYAVAYGVPCISGKDSMKNDYSIGDTKISIPPTLLFSTIGKIADVRKAVTMDAKKAGDLVYILGKTKRELGGSEWYALQDAVGNQVPQVDAKTAKTLYAALSKAIGSGLVASCHDCSDGGLGIALAEVAFAGGLGVNIGLARVPAEELDRDDEILFSESQSRFVVTVSPEKREAFEAALAGCVMGQIGTVTLQPILAIDGLAGNRIIEESIGDLKAVWQRPLNF